MDSEIKKYKARFGVTAWSVAIFCVAYAVLQVLVISSSWISCVLAIALVLLLTLPVFTVSYSIEGDTFSVHSLLQNGSFPIDKISEVRLSTGWLSAPATSPKRISIKFSDRKVLKSASPLEISPADREGFVRHLLEINPGIKLVE